MPGVNPPAGPNPQNGPIPGLRGAVHKAHADEPDAYILLSGRVTYTLDAWPVAQAIPTTHHPSAARQAADYVRCFWPVRNGVRWVMDFPNAFPVQPNTQFQRSVIVPRVVYNTMRDPQHAARIVEMREFLVGVRNAAPSPYDELPGAWPDLETFVRWLLRGTNDIPAAYCALYQIRYYANIDVHGQLRNMIATSWAALTVDVQSDEGPRDLMLF